MILDKYSRFTKVCYKHFTGFSVKHVINTQNFTTKSGEQAGESFTYVYDITDNTTHKTKKAVLVKYDDYISFNADAKNNGYRNEARSYFILNQGSFHKFIQRVDEAVLWLKDPSFDKLFSVDQEGVITGVTTNKIQAVLRSGKCWLMFTPTVVTDNLNITYQGIQMKSDNGVLCNFTADEYLNFVFIMKGLLQNFYSASLQLFNAAISTINKEEENHYGFTHNK